MVGDNIKKKILKPTKARLKGEIIYDWNKFQNNAEYEDIIVTRSDGSDTIFKDTSCTTQELTMEFIDTNITVTATNTTVNTPNLIEAHLTDEEDNNISGATVVFMIDNTDYTATTNSNGIAVLDTWTSSVNRTSVTVEAAYAGNYEQRYHSCTGPATFNVTGGS